VYLEVEPEVQTMLCADGLGRAGDAGDRVRTSKHRVSPEEVGWHTQAGAGKEKMDQLSER
jgi:hypothetical protein